MTNDDGGLAFPVDCDMGGEHVRGMTARDVFARDALRYSTVCTFGTPPAEIARSAFDLAQAMVDEKRKRDRDTAEGRKVR